MTGGRRETDVRVASPAAAARQGPWIAAMEPWRGLGYTAEVVGRFLGRAARAGQVLAIAAPVTSARPRRRGVAPAGADVAGVLVLQPDVLLGSFVALLAIRSDLAGRGLGRALMAEAEARTFAVRRWLYVSADRANAAALRFYRRLGFRRVAVLPDMVRPGRAEVLLRKGREGEGPARPAPRRAKRGASRPARAGALRVSGRAG